MNRLSLYCCIASFIFLSCNNQQSEKLVSNNSDTGHRNILYSIPVELASSRKQPFLRNLSNLMKLPLIYNGSKGLNIRIWIWEGDKKYVINIYSKDSINNAFITEFNIQPLSIKDSNSYIKIYREWKNLKPRSGWNMYYTSLNKFHIIDLNESNIQQRYKDFLTSMSYVQFEIATTDDYRYYEYLEPSFYRFIDDGSKDVYQFLEYLNADFGITIYNPPKELFIKPK